MTTSPKTTLYLRGMPSALVRAAKVTAAQRGSTLTALVTDSLARSLDDTQPPSDDDELGAEMRWYELNRDRLVRRYQGKYVAIVGRSVIDHDRDFSALASRVFARIGVRSCFMPRVEPSASTVRVRSPRLARQ